MLSLVEDKLLLEADNVKEKLYYLKMKADYLRYKVEIAKGDERSSFAEKAGDAYFEATEAAQYLADTDLIKLGVALNYSVFNYEILNDSNKACELAKEAFDNAINALDQVPDEGYKDSTLIMQLLRDNMALWECGNGL